MGGGVRRGRVVAPLGITSGVFSVLLAVLGVGLAIWQQHLAGPDRSARDADGGEVPAGAREADGDQRGEQ